MSDIGKDLFVRRRSLGISQKTLANKLGVSPSYICKIERGDIPHPNSTILERIEYVLQSDYGAMDDIFGVDDCDEINLELLEQKVKVVISELEDIRHMMKSLRKKGDVNV